MSDTTNRPTHSQPTQQTEVPRQDLLPIIEAYARTVRVIRKQIAALQKRKANGHHTVDLDTHLKRLTEALPPELR